MALSYDQNYDYQMGWVVMGKCKYVGKVNNTAILETENTWGFTLPRPLQLILK